MSMFLEVDHIEKVFPLPNGRHYKALSTIALNVRKGEFISLIGHSGCGKSTLLNIVAGLERPSTGGVVLEGRQVKGAGPDRMVVFQNYSLLPWKTVQQNIALGVNTALKHLPKGERRSIVEHYVDLVGLRAAVHKFPHELSGGMKQRVAIARALAIRPKLLLLDEPFGALDALTRGGLQDQLMKILTETKATCIMVTHDVDEAVLLSDRIVMLTNGPASYIGQILEVPIPRPRQRMDVVNHPSYYGLRSEILYFLNQQKLQKKRKRQQPLTISRHGLEKVNLNLGFVPLTDCAPLVVAKEQGFFAKHGLAEVTLSREPSWKTVLEGVTTGRLDAAQMVAGMPLAMTIGLQDKAPVPMVISLILSRNGNAITLSKDLYEKGVRTLADFKQYLSQPNVTPPTLGMVHPASMHNLMLRYWLAAGGIDPDRDLTLKVVPPPEMVANLRAGEIDGYCVGEPWNSHAVKEGLGFVITHDLELWPGQPEKVLGMREDWADQHPQTQVALVKALLEACQYCDDPRNRNQILTWLCLPQYVGAAAEVIQPGFLRAYDRGTPAQPQVLPRYNQFFVSQANFPDRVEGLWILTQLARWGLVPFPRNWIEVLDQVRRPEMFAQAAQELGLPGIGPDRHQFQLFDGMIFNPDDPMGYLDRLAIKRDIQIQEVLVGASAMAEGRSETIAA
ncbi:MAG: ABC transporter substrate-binding protein [Acaryochloris sp. RU_4_1]|nr:ABC transporter substrate-binding protein [Acaryochloris sp. SU_5_25]NJM65427.1 ABC transporter substrate-binding protein [Acaryochloris sp. RU_4_1]NJR54012.1 ABC transporter substrate-binding protein [Acaryochloris sp. CRU_2_0]